MQTDLEQARVHRRGPAIINLALGIWFFVSPWVFGAAATPSAWNAWIVGALLTLFAAIRLVADRGATFVAWYNMALGAWIFTSPFVFDYSIDSGRFLNSVSVGIVVFLVALGGRISANHPSRAQY